MWMYYVRWMTLLNRRPFKTSIIIMLILAVALPIAFPHSNTAAQTSDQSYEKNFSWDYGGSHWTWNLSIPKSLYEAYRSVPDSTRTRNGPEGYGYLTTTKDYYVQVLAQKLNETANNQGYDSYEKISFVLAFVQSLPYTSDNVTTGYDEYPRFPIETLVDGGGDCEDTAILFASLTLILGYGTVYINPPDHYAVGILGNNLEGSYFTYHNRTYYYCETTGNNFKIGQLPDEFNGESATIYPINEDSQYVPNVQIQIVEPTPTLNPHQATSPTIAQPTVEPASSLIKAITDNPFLFVVIIVAVAACIAITVKSIQKPKPKPYYSPPAMQEPFLTPENTKYCIYCGSSNSQNAFFCEKCGRQIGQ